MNNIDKVVLFDGVCNFCEASVQFIIKYDKSKSLKFASLQSNLGQSLLKQYNLPTAVEGVVFIEDNKAYYKSQAAFRILHYFSGLWKLLFVFSIFPTVFTDFFYDIFAKYRYKLFGKKDACMIPSPEVRSRFLEL